MRAVQLMGNKSCDSCWGQNTQDVTREDEQRKSCHMRTTAALNTDLQLVVPLECPAMSEVVLRMPRAGGTTPSSAWVRGTELARVETRRRSGWSSLRLRRRWLRLGSLKLRPLSRLIRLWDTTSSKRSRCFLGMKILANMVGSDTTSNWWGKVKESRGVQFLLFYMRAISHTLKGFTEKETRTLHQSSISAKIPTKSIIPSPDPSSTASKTTEGFLLWLRIVPAAGCT